MTTSSTAWKEEISSIAGVELQIIKGGTGEPLLILHDEIGHHEWLNYHQALSQNHNLHIPSHPGFGKTKPLEWIMNMRDMAGWYLQALDELKLGPINVVGFSMGGWLAAEMATMDTSMFKKIVLVGATGVKPPVGEIYDMFLEIVQNFITAGFVDSRKVEEFQTICPDDASAELVEAWEVAREEACRLGWKPYMYYAGLPQLLPRLKALPTLIVWGRQDAIVPISAGELYHQSIPGSKMTVLEDCGHRPEIEKTSDFVRLVNEFLNS